MTNEEKCKHYDKENGWCKKLSDWSDPMPHIVYCPKSPCEYAEPIEQPTNDNDIIKALGYCFAVGDCEHCIYADKPCQELMADALDIIIRQKAEIERLLKDCAEIDNFARDICKERMLKGKPVADFEDLQEYIKKKQAEAIKEFAERLRSKFFNYYDGLTENTSKSNHNGDTLMFYEVADMIEDCIDNLVKEMTEGEDDTGKEEAEAALSERMNE